MSRIELEPAFVLHTRPYRETSLIVEAFGRDTGRVGLIAKGARRPRSGLRGALQPFRPLLLSWSGRGELGVLAAAEPDGFVRTLAGQALFSGLYMNELLMRLTHRHDPHPELFHFYREAVDSLGSGRPTEAVLRIFEKHVLESIGYGLVLDREIGSGEPIEAGAVYRYEMELGPTDASSGTPGGVSVTGATLLALASEDLDTDRALEEAKRLMRAVLRRYLGDKPLATRTLFRSRARTTTDTAA